MGNWKKGLILLLLLSLSTYVYAIQTVTTVPAKKIVNGQKTVTNAGVAETLVAASRAVKSVSVKALSTNTGVVYVGDVNVDSTNGRELQAGESLDIDIDDLVKIYLDVSVNGEGVSYAAIL